MSVRKIDVHCHFLPDFYREALTKAGYVPGPDGINFIPEWSPEDHLAFNAQHGIQKSYLSISSPGTFLTPPTPDNTSSLRAAVALTQQCNDYGASLAREHRGAFGFLASLPLPDVSTAIAEIERCETDPKLRGHVSGFALLTNAHGMYLGDPAMAPVWEALTARRAVVFVHPTTPCCASSAPQTAVANERDPAVRRAANMPLADSYAAPMLEFLFDSTRAVVDLLLTGTIQRYAGIKWVFPHCGAALPSLLDRVVRFSGIMGEKPGSRRGQSTRLSVEGVQTLFAERCWFDMAGMCVPAMVSHMRRWIGWDRFVFGSDVPFTPWGAASELVREWEASVGRWLDEDVGCEHAKGLCETNARRLFGDDCELVTSVNLSSR